MEEIENLLSEEFVSFSKKIEEIFHAKKERKAQFKVVYDQYTAEMKAYDDQAKALKEEFESSAKARVMSEPKK